MASTQYFLDVAGLKTTTFCKEVFSSSTMPTINNATLLCLIPKYINIASLKNFKPIGFCNTTYKIVTKIIVNKINPYLSSIIGPIQASFLTNKGVSDYAIIIREYISHFRKMKEKKPNKILKINLKKAFVKLEWSFIKDTLYFFNLPNNLTKLITSCVTTSFIAILVNGRKINYFYPTKDIRQGDPMSPYLS